MKKSLLLIASTIFFVQFKIEAQVCIEKTIGATYYDLVTNSSSRNQISANPTTNEIVITWTTLPGPGSPKRGSGLARTFTGGTTWFGNNINPADTNNRFRIENFRTGWPSIVYPRTKNPIIFNHTTTNPSNKIWMLKHIAGPIWDSTTTDSILPPATALLNWPRVANKGDTIYLIATTTNNYGNQLNHLLFARSYDGGVNWAKSTNGTAWWTINGFCDSQFFTKTRGDSYNIACKGNTVAIVAANSWGGVRYAKSNDAGQTWVTGWVDSLPRRLYDPANGFPGQPGSGISDFNNDGIADTVLSNDESVSVVLDNNFQMHVTYGQMNFVDDDPNVNNPGWNYFPKTDGLAYWNESMPANTPAKRKQGINVIAKVADLNNNGKVDYLPAVSVAGFGKSLSSIPTMASDNNGNVYIVYQSLVECSKAPPTRNSIDSGNVFHVYIKVRTPNGNFSLPYDVTCIDQKDSMAKLEYYFPSVYPELFGPNNRLLVMCQRDSFPFQGGQSPLRTDVVYFDIDPSSIFVFSSVAESLHLSSFFNLFPNPANETFFLTYKLPQSVAIKHEIFDLEGRKLFSKDENAASGENKTEFNLKLQPGIYFVKSSCSYGTVTKKLVVQ